VEKLLCKKIDGDIAFDLDVQGRLVGIESLSVSEHMNVSGLLLVDIGKKAVK
jgi:uncharacterized protein YuzE